MFFCLIIIGNRFNILISTTYFDFLQSCIRECAIRGAWLRNDACGMCYDKCFVIDIIILIIFIIVGIKYQFLHGPLHVSQLCNMNTQILEPRLYLNEEGLDFRWSESPKIIFKYLIWMIYIMFVPKWPKYILIIIIVRFCFVQRPN